MFDLWLELFTQVDESKDEIPPHLLENEETREAIKYLEEGAYTKAQMYAYDKFRESSMIELALQEDALAKVEKGRAEGRAEGIAKVAKNLKNDGMPTPKIAEVTGLTVQQVEEL
jgi:predicted transposase/invertase (TIGR01784 family)